MAIVKVKELNQTFYKCNRCGHTWQERAKARKYGSKLPTLCPKCKSPYWNVEGEKGGKKS